MGDSRVVADDARASARASVKPAVNRMGHDLRVEPRTSLLDALRGYIGLTGTNKGCNQGACGACRGLVDGERIISCMIAGATGHDRRVGDRR